MKRFWDKVKKGEPDECWEWIAGKNPSGYGKIQMKGDAVGAHRVSYELHHGAIPEGLMVLHSCDNPACVNPAHLRVGTPLDNMQDKMMRGRHRTVCGMQQPTSKLTELQVMKIRMLRGIFTQRRLAEMFGITQENVHCVQVGKSWKHLDPAPGNRWGL